MQQLQQKLTETFQLTTDEWDLLERKFSTQSLRKGEFFIEEHKVCRNSGFILEGLMRYFSYDKEGNDPTCYFSYEHHYVTDPFTFKKQTPSDMNLQAVTDCTLWVISIEADRELQTLLPRWNDITNRLLLEVGMEFANQKELLSMNASERYDHFLYTYPLVAQRAPLQYVASYLGIAQPSLSRIRKENARKTGA